MWKKEISFSRKPKAPKADAQVVPAIAASEAPVPKQSALKKDISFSRKPKEKKEMQAKAPEQASSSFLKKEISFSRKPKAPKAEAAPKAEKTSFLKKDI